MENTIATRKMVAILVANKPMHNGLIEFIKEYGWTSDKSVDNRFKQVLWVLEPTNYSFDDEGDKYNLYDMESKLYEIMEKSGYTPTEDCGDDAVYRFVRTIDPNNYR